MSHQWVFIMCVFTSRWQKPAVLLLRRRFYRRSVTNSLSAWMTTFCSNTHNLSETNSRIASVACRVSYVVHAGSFGYPLLAFAARKQHLDGGSKCVNSVRSPLLRDKLTVAIYHPFYVTLKAISNPLITILVISSASLAPSSMALR